MDFIKKHGHLFPVILIIFIFAQSLPFKFGLVESVTPDHIFPLIGRFLGLGFYENYGGQITGLIEIGIIALLLRSKTRIYGAVLASSLLAIAIFFHFTVIGISVPVNVPCPSGVLPEPGMSDCVTQDPTLFIMAIVGLLSGLYLTYRRRTEIPFINKPAGGPNSESD